ncbi:alcohol dehydrogenase catalytic domain-containing protein [Kitasatospora sp. NPDC001603]|uniref:zinc-dependent alcohol dehydrogenase n=1 Tax=Kitasatospora sp. NPDC001603 TaxID=3154388 RepID=UPI003324DC47
MESLVYSAPWTVRVVETEEPRLSKPDDVLVEVKAVGICGTDLGIIAGQYPAVRPPVVLGHEAVGVVHAVGSGIEDLIPGERVAIDPTYACLHCHMCTTGRPNHCLRKDGTESGVSADGMFRKLHLTQRRFVHRIAPHVPFENAALTEPLSCVLTGVAQLLLRTDYHAAVIGAGPMGLLYAHALAVQGVRGTLIEISPQRRALAEQAAPAGWMVARDLDAALRQGSRKPYGAGGGRGNGESLRDLGFDIIVDTSGFALESSLAFLARGGQLLSVGLGGTPVTVDPVVFADHSKRIVGSIDSLNGSFAAALDLITTGRVPADRLVSHVLPLSAHREALALLGVDLAERRRVAPADALKVVLVP